MRDDRIALPGKAIHEITLSRRNRDLLSVVSWIVLVQRKEARKEKRESASGESKIVSLLAEKFLDYCGLTKRSDLTGVFAKGGLYFFFSVTRTGSPRLSAGTSNSRCLKPLALTFSFRLP